METQHFEGDYHPSVVAGFNDGIPVFRGDRVTLDPLIYAAGVDLLIGVFDVLVDTSNEIIQSRPVARQGFN